MASASGDSFTTTAGVNMRAEASTDSRVVRVVSIGSRVDVLEHNPAGWSRVQSGNSTGFIRSDFLRFPIGNTAATFRTTEGVNIRASASTTANVMQTVPRGTSIEVTEHNPAGWSRVRIGSTNGFIRSDFLARGSGAISSTATTESVVATLRTTAAVNFRAGPATTYRAIRTLASNTSVEVLENQANGWSRVRHNNTDGFIRSDLLSATGAPQQQVSLRTTGAVNFRTGPATTYRAIRLLAANTSVNVLESQANGWSRVSHNGTNGFIRSDLLSAAGASSSGNSLGTQWTITGVNKRAGASTGYSVIRLLSRSTSVEVLENLANGWSRVRHNGSVGFIRSDLLSASRPASTANQSLGQQIANFARQFEGHRYTWGGASPATGFDCSGLVTYVMRNFGITMSRTSAAQFRNNGVPVSRSELQPGDLVFFSSNGSTVTHVGIYLGGDRFIHASGRNVGVVISQLSARTLFGARRVV